MFRQTFKTVVPSWIFYTDSLYCFDTFLINYYTAEEIWKEGKSFDIAGGLMVMPSECRYVVADDCIDNCVKVLSHFLVVWYVNKKGFAPVTILYILWKAPCHESWISFLPELAFRQWHSWFNIVFLLMSPVTLDVLLYSFPLESGDLCTVPEFVHSPYTTKKIH